MKLILPLIVSLLAVTVSASAQEAPRHAGYAPLENLVGRWTIPGKEDTYVETCAWYHGERHIVCNTESTRADGSVAHGMSILGFIPDQGYVYTGIGSGGRYETYRDGKFAEGAIQYIEQTADGWTRISVGPFDDSNRIPFNVHTSKDGETWEAADSFDYIRVD